MKNKKQIDGKILRAMILAGANRLENEKSDIDNLNVFPVPDGDTGTNMALTLASAAKTVNNLPENAKLNEVAEKMAYGSLMGARGNSGVILSQLLGGFAKAIGENLYMDSTLLAQAFINGVDAAYKAVVKPIEGTILTVAREASQKVSEEVTTDWDIIETLEIFIKQGEETLTKTPEMLPVLKQAGVVDAGGQGLLTIIKGMLAGLKGEDLLEIPKNKASYNSPTTTINDFTLSEDNIEFEYCTELIIKKYGNIQIQTEKIRSFLEEKGDCVLVVGSEGITKIHVHTNNPGLVLEYCSQLGSLHDIKIENMREQSKELQVGMSNKKIGVIAVSIGEGLNEIFRSLGVDYIITGGQTMNPSTEDFLLAIKEVDASELIILPNNKNIVLAAQQAAAIVEKPVKVIVSKTITQGIGALMAFNGELDLKTNSERMQETITQIKTGEITYAVRNAQHDDKVIRSGQLLGIVEGKISVVSEDLAETITKVVDELIDNNDELVTLYYGSDVKKNDAEKMVDKLASLYPEADFELHYGGQPLYYYFISVE